MPKSQTTSQPNHLLVDIWPKYIGPVVRKSQFKFPFDSEKSHYEMEK